MNRARFSKREKKYEDALQIINEILEQDPSYPEVLYLKAEILWEGFNNMREALICLKEVKELSNKDEPIYRWAKGFQDELQKLKMKQL